MIELGGNIELVGFRDLEGSQMIVLKKIIGNFARKFSDGLENYEKLTITLKGVHSSKYEVHGKLIVEGKPVNADVTENNLYVAVSDTLKKIEAQALK